LKNLSLKDFLDVKVKTFNSLSFIEKDPISIPKKFTKIQDIEIIGLWVALLSWGQRKTIINSGKKLIELMDNDPYKFVLHHKERDRKRFLKFVHRTFQPTDALYFLDFFQNFYRQNHSLESAFYCDQSLPSPVKEGLLQFRNVFFNSKNLPNRTKKHIASPYNNSSCKRLNMFLRWMVRDDGIVDFGIWKTIDKKHLFIPLDIHVHRVARKLGLLQREKSDWKAVVELTTNLRTLDPSDPVKYDYALFGLGILQKEQQSWRT
jgi:uncharacterized protein (TIGR02757 family)